MYTRIILLFCLTMLSCKNEASIKLFNPINFDWETEQLMIKQEKGKLYSVLNKNGRYGDLLYEFKNETELLDYSVFMSPDSKHLIIDDDELYLMDLESRILETIKVDGKVCVKRDKYLKAHKDIQWSSDSKKIAVVSKDLINGNFSKINIINIDDNSTVITKEVSELLSCFFSKDSHSILYKYFNTPNTTSVKDFSIELETTIAEYEQYPDNNIFVNIFPGDLLNHTPDLLKRVIDIWKYDPVADVKSGNYLLSSDTLKLLLEGNDSGRNFKDFTSSNHVYNSSYFLPGGKYYIFLANIKEYKGYLLLDTRTNKYQKIDGDIKFYYALNSNHFGETINGRLKYIKDFYSGNIKAKGDNLKVIY